MVGGFALFMVGFMFLAVGQFNDDVDVISSYQEAKIKTISQTERVLIEDWVKSNGVTIPEGKGYRYVISRYPTKPWLK